MSIPFSGRKITWGAKIRNNRWHGEKIELNAYLNKFGIMIFIWWCMMLNINKVLEKSIPKTAGWLYMLVKFIWAISALTGKYNKNCQSLFTPYIIRNLNSLTKWVYESFEIPDFLLVSCCRTGFLTGGFVLGNKRFS